MILGAFVLKMRAIERASLPVSHGRLLHAALLDLIRKYDNELAEELHNDNIKLFSLSTMSFKTLRSHSGNFNLDAGTMASWKVYSLDYRLSNLLLHIEEKLVIRVGRVLFEIISINLLKDKNGEVALIGTEQILEKSLMLLNARNFTIKFLSPTTFRYFEADYPFPKIDLIFSSLIERWNKANDKFVFAQDKLKEIAQRNLVPVKWQGETRRVNLTAKTGVTGFVGSFTFDMSNLPDDYRRIYIILLEFASYSGVGRLTAQGLGRVSVEYDL